MFPETHCEDPGEVAAGMETQVHDDAGYTLQPPDVMSKAKPQF